jgi:hypothetical protein
VLFRSHRTTCLRIVKSEISRHSPNMSRHVIRGVKILDVCLDMDYEVYRRVTPYEVSDTLGECLDMSYYVCAYIRECLDMSCEVSRHVGVYLDMSYWVSRHVGRVFFLCLDMSYEVSRHVERVYRHVSSTRKSCLDTRPTCLHI